MKKIIGVLLSVCLCLLVSSCAMLAEISVFYNEIAHKNGFDIEINRKANCCFVGKYECQIMKESYEVTVPGADTVSIRT